MAVLWTNFYISKIERNSRCSPILETNYNAYTLFTFENWLYPQLKDDLNDYSIEYSEVLKNGRKYLTIKFITIDDFKLDQAYLNKLQEIINTFDIIDEKFIYLFYYDQEVYTEFNDKIPKIWINSMLRYVEIDPGFQVHLGKYGLLFNVKGYPNYGEITLTLQLKIREKLITAFKKGFIVNPPEKIIKNWGLLNVSDGLYQIQEVDSRLFTQCKYVSNFLLSLITGINTISLEFPNDFLYRHLFTERAYSIGLNDFVFTDDGLDLTVDTINQARQALNIIDLIQITEPEKTQLEFLYLSKIDEITVNQGLIYKVDDLERPFVYSRIV